jgi:NAD(P)-dependent dehydrogenase (short-subunit alcohol dehydrogenase family)
MPGIRTTETGLAGAVAGHDHGMTPNQPPQSQSRPGSTEEMRPKPKDEMADYTGSGLLNGKRCLVTGGDSGIGKAVAIAFAKEGADVAIAYLSEHEDAKRTASVIEQLGKKCVLIDGDLSKRPACDQAVATTVAELGGLDVLVNNIAFQQPQESLTDISDEQWQTTFDTNMSSYFWTTRAALQHLGEGSSIINTASINGLRGNKSLIDYSATKGAILAFTYSMAQSLTEKKIRVNCVAPGPVWTPLIPSTMGEEKSAEFGNQVPMQRAAQPDEIAPSFVFFASNQMSSYYTGEVLAPIGGETLPG